LVTPTRTLYSGQAEMIVCRAVDGEIAFLANHMPYIGALDTSVVRIVGPEGLGEIAGTSPAEIRLAVHGGFVEVKDNQVIMLADAAELATEVDVEAARRAESEASQAVSAATEDNPNPGAEAALRWAQARLDAASPEGSGPLRSAPGSAAPAGTGDRAH
jgi:F-type H+-transporting ATPase subunit epsilon